MNKIMVLGAGLVGKAMVLDLNKDHEVTAVDANAEKLAELESAGVKCLKLDLSAGEVIKKVINGFDLVVGAVPGYMGHHVMKNVIEAGQNMVDISFMPEDPGDLHELAQESGVCVVTDCGIAPGMSNVILGYHNKEVAF